MINLRTAPCSVRVAVGVALSAALSGIPTVLIMASPTAAAPGSGASYSMTMSTVVSDHGPPTSESTTTSDGASTTTTTTTTTTTATSTQSVTIKGKTSQGRPISFRLTPTAVEKLNYRVADRCPGGRHLFVHSWGFPPLPIKNSRFGGKFVAKAPAAATTKISGKITDTHVTGSLSDRTRSAKTHRFCSGKATFNLRIPTPKQTPPPHQGPSPQRPKHS
jgi:hypothetical protein